eukprot:2067251-Prymnesium_polylepis.1
MSATIEGFAVALCCGMSGSTLPSAASSVWTAAALDDSSGAAGHPDGASAAASANTASRMPIWLACACACRSQTE